MLNPLLLLPAPSGELLSLWSSSGTVARLVLIVLLLLSVLTWGLVIERWYSIRHARHDGARFSAAVTAQGNYVKAAQEVGRHPDGAFKRIFLEGYNDLKGQLDESMAGSDAAATMKQGYVPRLLSEESLQRAFVRAIDREITGMERGMAILATTASAAPFIGLFGTVWGVMNAFMGIANSGSASLTQVAPGISEALITTAFGLFTAIPALVAFNLLGRSIKVARREMEFFASEAVGLAVRKYGEKAG